MKPRLSSVATNSSEDEYLTPAPPPLPTARRFDITLSQLLTCTMDELAHRYQINYLCCRPMISNKVMTEVYRYHTICLPSSVINTRRKINAIVLQIVYMHMQIVYMYICVGNINYPCIYS